MGCLSIGKKNLRSFCVSGRLLLGGADSFPYTKGAEEHEQEHE